MSNLREKLTNFSSVDIDINVDIKKLTEKSSFSVLEEYLGKIIDRYKYYKTFFESIDSEDDLELKKIVSLAVNSYSKRIKIILSEMNRKMVLNNE